MAISFACGTCGKPYKVDERFVGKKAKCRNCGAVNKIPDPASYEPPRRANPPGLLAVEDEPDLPVINIEEDIKFDRALEDAAAAEGDVNLAENIPTARRVPKRVLPIPALAVST